MDECDILLLISDLEGAHYHCRRLGFDEDRETIRRICDNYYKLYFKVKKANTSGKSWLD